MWQTCLDIPKIVMVLSADSVNASTYKPKQLGLVLYCHFSCGVFFLQIAKFIQLFQNEYTRANKEFSSCRQANNINSGTPDVPGLCS